MEPPIAHIREEEKGCFAEQSIEEHCLNVARLARELIYEDEDSYGMKDLAYNAGLLHDFGKYRPDFQRYILSVSGANQSGKVPPKAPHAIVGAIEARRLFDDPMIADTLAYCISGHHRGLYDHNEMERRLRHGEHKRWCDACEKLTSVEDLGTTDCDDVGEPYDLQMAIRMLFSALVDADRLDTEQFMTPDLSAERSRIRSNYAPLCTLRERLIARTESFRSAPDTPVNRARAYFLESCRTHGAGSDPGIYTLSLPTGAGKTISSMAWALEMAMRNHHDRIIYVIPYTSIITQTAMVFREIFGKENILEHHSEVVVEQQTEDDKSDEQMSRLKFLTENWDAPIILTTNVQFFESLFASKPAKCRKVHSIANSVIVMDEVQALPEGFLSPILSAIDTLSEAFHCSILCCSATRMLLHKLSNKITDPTDPEVIAKYYRLYFKDIPDFDTEGIAQDLTEDPEDINFESAAERFKLIDDEGTFPVIVPYMEEGKALVGKIRNHEILTREDYHRMQEYSVSLRQGDYSTLLSHGNIEQIPWGEDFISVLVDAECYDSVAGVVISNHWVEETQTA